jgi:hypothetical protein
MQLLAVPLSLQAIEQRSSVDCLMSTAYSAYQQMKVADRASNEVVEK